MVRAKARIKTGYMYAVVPNYLKVKYACKMRVFHINFMVIMHIGFNAQHLNLSL
jgi:hypothetical protein